MSEGDVVEVVNVPNNDVLPLTGLKLYNSFKKTLPKGLAKDTVALRWLEYRIMLGLPIIEKKVKIPKEKIPKEKNEKAVRFKIEKVKKDKKVVKKSVLDENNNMIGDFDIGSPLIVIPDIVIPLVESLA